jgi:hypothetical protein
VTWDPDKNELYCYYTDQGRSNPPRRETTNVSPIDANGVEIQVGDRIMFPMKSGGKSGGARIGFGTVLEIMPPTRLPHWFGRVLVIHDDTGKKVRHNEHENCIKFDSINY